MTRSRCKLELVFTPSKSTKFVHGKAASIASKFSRVTNGQASAKTVCGRAQNKYEIKIVNFIVEYPFFSAQECFVSRQFLFPDFQFLPALRQSYTL
jgi:hypothetical protein